VRSVPVARDELFDYDVMNFGDVDPRLLPRSVWTDVRKFVAEKGGAWCSSPGRDSCLGFYTDVHDAPALFPVEFDALASTGGRLPKDISNGFLVQPTPLGLQAGPMQLGDTLADT